MSTHARKTVWETRLAEQPNAEVKLNTILYRLGQAIGLVSEPNSSGVPTITADPDEILDQAEKLIRDSTGIER